MYRNCVQTGDCDGLGVELIDLAELVDWIQHEDRSACCATSQERIRGDEAHASDRIGESALRDTKNEYR